MLQLKLIEYIDKNRLFTIHDKVIVAASGGIDSMVLVDLIQHAGIPYIIAHCNFGLRGVESDGDELFVQSIAAKYKVTFLSKSFNTTEYAAKKNISIQIAARELRYQWFEEIAQKESIANVLLAHHADDVAETMLINLCRGTGLAGLHGILPRNGLFARPLLFAQRSEIQAHAEEHNIKYREDSTNKKDKYARNNIRHHVIPALKASYPEAVQSFNKTAAIITAQENVYRKQIQDFIETTVTKTENHIAIQIDKVLHFIEPEIALFEILNPYGYNASQVSDILTNIAGQSGAIYLSSTHQLIRDRQQLFLTLKTETNGVESYTIKDTNDINHLPIILNFEKSIKNSDSLISDNPNCIAVDVSKLTFPLVLRKWQQGDYFQPFGMRGRKKVSDFFNDLKIPTHLKSHIYLLESNKEVVWIVGYRMCDGIKITNNTQEILKISVD